MRNSRLRPLVFLALAICIAPLAHADWMDEYDRGLKAVAEGQWAEAERRFANALRENAEPSASRRFKGTTRKPYVPQYYAGLAAYRQNACDRALQYWNHAGNLGVIATLGDLKGVQANGIADCQGRLAANTTTSPPAPTAKPPEVSSPPGAAQTQAPALQTSAPAVPTPAPATKPVASKPVEAAPVQKPVAAPRAPAALLEAIRQYLQGRYVEAARLSPDELPDAQARAHGYLVRAAARHRLAELDGGDAAQLRLVQQDIRAARTAQATLVPDEILFPPRFRELWRQTR
jgi:tetratricopeptide (TPR) repeat protein